MRVHKRPLLRRRCTSAEICHRSHAATALPSAARDTMALHSVGQLRMRSFPCLVRAQHDFEPVYQPYIIPKNHN